ncbi:lipoprotein signal peptidase [Pseudomethylobacillus aquaticus]|uniref:Lipoprotein signal peptidase n=1 Tax=Pseudomethylobacillus aquaticus TaxID=2676064 RepID=A0A3N0V3A3_9PROT|nr:signal peptidase II [Pseudomethylobacillus aquaticus]ROH87185.1 lipoprotein signal peptidase [Pseudomethylobacillus aquaticus]
MKLPLFLKWLLLSSLVIALDLYTKHLVLQAFAYGDHLTITSYFDLVRFHNEGAAFSFLADAGGWQKHFFSAVAMIASAVMIYLLYKSPAQKLYALGLSLVLAGALGNLYDRVTLGYVVDFLFFHYEDYYWPAFNVADSAICVGVALLLIDSFRPSRRPS